MSLSIDDLVASFSSSHVGQEALDLQALHAQLAQTLYPAHAGAAAPCAASPKMCTTPTAHGAPAPALHASHFGGAWAQPPEIARRMSAADDADDERMVEDLLLCPPPSAPASFTSPAQTAPAPAQFGFTNEPEAYSTFALSDPFYLATVQAQQQQQQQMQTHAAFGAPAPGHGPNLFAQAQAQAAAARAGPFAWAQQQQQQQLASTQQQQRSAFGFHGHPMFAAAT